jgi:hypothetical protein
LITLDRKWTDLFVKCRWRVVAVDVAIKKVSVRDGQDRFILVNAATRDVVTVHDVSEATLCRFLRAQGASDDLIDKCLTNAHAQFGQALGEVSVPTNDAQETMGDDDLLFELGLSEDS